MCSTPEKYQAVQEPASCTRVSSGVVKLQQGCAGFVTSCICVDWLLVDMQAPHTAANFCALPEPPWRQRAVVLQSSKGTVLIFPNTGSLDCNLRKPLLHGPGIFKASQGPHNASSMPFTALRWLFKGSWPVVLQCGTDLVSDPPFSTARQARLERSQPITYLAWLCRSCLSALGGVNPRLHWKPSKAQVSLHTQAHVSFGENIFARRQLPGLLPPWHLF